MFRYRRRYVGPLQAVIFDWAGTIVDHGCMAPAAVFLEVFAKRGVPITMAEARGPMGAEKRLHIATIAAMPAVADRWRTRRGTGVTDRDIDALYAAFIPAQIACLSRYSKLIPGTLKTVVACRKRGLKIGTTTGYNRAMNEVNLRDAAKQGFTPDCSVSSSDVPIGRPGPAMCLRNAIDLEASTIAACVKVDDTVPGIEEGLAAGMWTVAVTVSGNEIGMPLAQARRLPKKDLAVRRAKAESKLAQAGSHYVIDSVADLLPCLDDIEARLGRGERP
ncbi:MAG: phosphonoacetaldehyde hydrolase [Alphaproteobacteria bacterium]|nr:phosphonoacetaldehyde hydrolase [Alphaproteobacteria bacterium]